MNYYNEIKNVLVNNEINKNVKNCSINKSDLNTYYKVGKLLLDTGNQYGENIIKEYSLRLTEELGLGYSQRNLRNMRQFYKVSQKWQTLSAKLSWSHYCEILWFDENKFKYYVKVAELKKEHTGQIQTYMNYMDKNIKTVEENDTVGIIICKQDNEYIIKYCSDDRIIAREYELAQ